MSAPSCSIVKLPSALGRMGLMGLMGLMAIALVPPGFAAACPPSEMTFGGASFFSSAAVFDSSAGLNGNAGVRTAYNLPGGTVEILHCCGLGVGSTQARDAFDVVGVSPGTPVPVMAELDVDGVIISEGCGASGCWGYLEGSITADQITQKVTLQKNIFAAEVDPVSGVAQLPVTIVAGSPKIIEFRMAAWRSPGGAHGGRGVGNIRFTGLPAGARVVSCNGYDNVVVPTTRTSWGRVKTIYR